MYSKLTSWLKREKVFCISALCAIMTIFLVPPDAAYLSYIDLRVLCLLLCLMAVVAGFQKCGAFHTLAARLLRSCKNGRILGVTLVLLPFFSSMLITNDVALLTFVPFTILLLREIRFQHAIIPILILQTIAANLGSMATPVGNPQNLFLYAAYQLSAGAFFSVMLPLTLTSLVGLTAAALPVLPRVLPELHLSGNLQNPRQLWGYGILFLLCLLTVFRILPYSLLTVLVLLCILWMDAEILRHLDYTLLGTFVCFFIVSGNLGRLDSIRVLLQALLEKDALLTSIAASQIISNVPTAVLLSHFTDTWIPLLQGVNIGGLGTPIASLASLITLKQYLSCPDAKPGRYLTIFTFANLVGLALMLGAVHI